MVKDYFEIIKEYTAELGLPIVDENPLEGIVMVTDHLRMLNNLVIDVEDPILVMEMPIISIDGNANPNLFLQLCQMNRQLVHGAFVVDEVVTKVSWFDTLQIENLDINELEGSVNALTLAMEEFGAELLRYNVS